MHSLSISDYYLHYSKRIGWMVCTTVTWLCLIVFMMLPLWNQISHISKLHFKINILLVISMESRLTYDQWTNVTWIKWPKMCLYMRDFCLGVHNLTWYGMWHKSHQLDQFWKYYVNVKSICTFIPCSTNLCSYTHIVCDILINTIHKSFCWNS